MTILINDYFDIKQSLSDFICLLSKSRRRYKNQKSLNEIDSKSEKITKQMELISHFMRTELDMTNMEIRPNDLIYLKAKRDKINKQINEFEILEKQIQDHNERKLK